MVSIWPYWIYLIWPLNYVPLVKRLSSNLKIKPRNVQATFTNVYLYFLANTINNSSYPYMKVEFLTKYHSSSSNVLRILLASNQDCKWRKYVSPPNTAVRGQDRASGFPKKDKLWSLHLNQGSKQDLPSQNNVSEVNSPSSVASWLFCFVFFVVVVGFFFFIIIS